MQCTLTGPGVTDGINKEKHSFDYRLKDAELASIVVAGPHGVAQKVHLDPENSRGWFDAHAAGQYIVSVTFTKVIELENVEPTVSGSALEGGVVSGPVSFDIDTGIPTGGHTKDITIQVVDPDGNRIEIGELLDNDDGTYEGGKFYPTVKGRYRISVLVWGQEVAGSPFRPVFELASAERSFASGLGVEGGPKAKRGMLLAFTIHSRTKTGDPIQEGGEPFRATVKGIDFDEECTVVDNDDGTYNVEYKPPSAGNYMVNITLHDRPLAPCPYKVLVSDVPVQKERKERRETPVRELKKMRPQSISRSPTPPPIRPIAVAPPPRSRSASRSSATNTTRSRSPPRGAVVQYRYSRSRSPVPQPRRPPPPPGSPPRPIVAHPAYSPKRRPRSYTPSRERSPVRPSPRRGSPHRSWSRQGPPQRLSRSPVRRTRSISPRHIPNQLWVGGLPHDYTEADMQHLFGRFGRLTNIDLRTGWAFLTFAEHEDATEAQRTLHRQSYEGRVLQVEFRMEKGAQKGNRDLRVRGKGGKGEGKGSGSYGGGQGGHGGGGGPASAHDYPQHSSNLDEHQRHMINGRPKNWRIEVEGLARSCGWQELKDWARECGLTPAFAVAVDGGVGVVDFATKREFMQALQQLSRKLLDGREVRIYPARWQPDSAGSRSPSRGRGRKRSRSRSRSRSWKRNDGDDRAGGRQPPRGSGRMPLAEMRRLGHAPPGGYVCHGCNEPGHWREHCNKGNARKRMRSRSRSPSGRSGRSPSRSPDRRRSRSGSPEAQAARPRPSSPAAVQDVNGDGVAAKQDVDGPVNT